MEPRLWSCSLAAGCLLLLGCWGPEEAVAAVSVGRPPCSLQARRELLSRFKHGVAEGGLPGGRDGAEGTAAGRGF